MAGGQALPGRNRRATARTQDPIVETEPVADAEVRPKKAYRSLFAQILVAVVAGIAVGTSGRRWAPTSSRSATGSSSWSRW
jgi:hypothetical protein